MPRRLRPIIRESTSQRVDFWNASYPVGTPVLYFAVPGDGSTLRETKTTSRAFVAGGAAVIYLRGVQCWNVPYVSLAHCFPSHVAGPEPAIAN